MFRRPLQQFVSKRVFSTDTCKTMNEQNKDILKNIFVLCLTNSLGITVLLWQKK